ncbi:hypothetical protein EVAR_92718_1 [Eumeta japonica]|uniref:Uncharacterized protein n=1 Tax=Eumeta variegata TaxID=151549 RepID=A0A4C1SXW6_EUMVA|nr:hypothetical protein EVAR_92718_1 [Eumeta japonica]
MSYLTKSHSVGHTLWSVGGHGGSGIAMQRVDGGAPNSFRLYAKCPVSSAARRRPSAVESSRLVVRPRSSEGAYGRVQTIGLRAVYNQKWDTRNG